MNRMGSEISRLRKEVGMTQKQLAKLVGVTENFIIDVEAGRKILNGDLITKISKALRKKAGKLDLFQEDESIQRPEPEKNVVKVIEKPVQDTWNDALAGVLMNVPVYTYNMDKALDTKKLPIIANKVEGHPKDKVFYLSIEDNEMAGFKISKDALALAYSTHEIEKDAIFLIQYNGRRLIRQVRAIEGGKLLLVSNGGKLSLETVSKNDVKIIARLIRLEIML